MMEPADQEEVAELIYLTAKHRPDVYTLDGMNVGLTVKGQRIAIDVLDFMSEAGIGFDEIETDADSVAARISEWCVLPDDFDSAFVYPILGILNALRHRVEEELDREAA